MLPQYTVKATAPTCWLWATPTCPTCPPAGTEEREAPACHGHRDCEPTEMRAVHTSGIVAGKEEVAAAQGTSVSGEVGGQGGVYADTGCHHMLPS